GCGHRPRVGSRGGAGGRRRPENRRPLRPAVPPLRAAPAPALPVVPPLRPRLLHAGGPRSVLQRGGAAAHVSIAREGVRRLLAPVARNTRLGQAFLPARAAA